MDRLESPTVEQFPSVQATPLYSQLTTVFRSLIRSSKWPVGSALPSEARLARQYGVSVGTARKALESLEESGWITRKQGRGTFVSDPAEQQFNRFCRLFRKDDRTSLFEELHERSLRQSITQANEEEARALGTKYLPTVVRLERVLEKDGMPVMVEHLILLNDLFPDMSSRKSLPVTIYDLFLREYGVVIHRCTETIEALMPPQDIAHLFEIGADAAILHTRCKLEGVDGAVIGLINRWLEPKTAEYSVMLT